MKKLFSRNEALKEAEKIVSDYKKEGAPFEGLYSVRATKQEHEVISNFIDELLIY